jgi:hypothetical protein
MAWAKRWRPETPQVLANVRRAANMTAKVRVNVRPLVTVPVPATRAFLAMAKDVRARYHRCRCHLPLVTGWATAKSTGPARSLRDGFLSCLGSFRLGWIDSFRDGVRAGWLWRWL